MENQPSNTPVKIGMGVSVLSFIFAACSVIYFAVASLNPGIGNLLWLISWIAAGISGLCYLSDLPRAMGSVKRNHHRALNLLLSVFLIAGIPLFLVVGSSILWLPFHLLLFVLEAIVIRKKIAVPVSDSPQM